ncbi:hypothetical protein [Pseudomonas citri]|uniref:hypothetical protein n=1 Tax=Pseudomonas citri TaxID=2978349 RepID=UPI0021B673D8|nr:hypothetical protein [Pseudomonas citri]
MADQLEIIGRYGGRRNMLVAHSFGTGLALSALLLGTQLERPLSRGGLMALPTWLLEILRPLLSRGGASVSGTPRPIRY